MVFALFPEHVGVRPRLYLELVLGSFQVTNLIYFHSDTFVYDFRKPKESYFIEKKLFPLSEMLEHTLAFKICSITVDFCSFHVLSD